MRPFPPSSSNVTSPRRIARVVSVAAALFAALTLAGARSAAAQSTGSATGTSHAEHTGHDAHAASADAGASGVRAHGKASHGGQVLMVGQQHVEFLATPEGVLNVWLTNRAQKPVPAPTGASVTLTSGANTVTLPLVPDAARQQLTARFDPATYRTFEAALRLPVEGGEPGAQRTVRFTVPAAR